MRELLLLVGLMSVGYFAQSSVGIALNQSCAIYEDLATESRCRPAPHKPSASQSPATMPAISSRFASSLDSSSQDREVADHSGTTAPEHDDTGILTASDMQGVKVTQTAPKSRRTSRQQ